MSFIYIHFPDKSLKKVLSERNKSIMQIAKENKIKGIDAECGGALACATCHVYVDGQSEDFISPLTTDEDDMLNLVSSERRRNSRLSCQIYVEKDKDIHITIPDSQ